MTILLSTHVQCNTGGLNVVGTNDCLQHPNTAYIGCAVINYRYLLDAEPQEHVSAQSSGQLVTSDKFNVRVLFRKTTISFRNGQSTKHTICPTALNPDVHFSYELPNTVDVNISGKKLEQLFEQPTSLTIWH